MQLFCQLSVNNTVWSVHSHGRVSASCSQVDVLTSTEHCRNEGRVGFEPNHMKVTMIYWEIQVKLQAFLTSVLEVNSQFLSLTGLLTAKGPDGNRTLLVKPICSRSNNNVFIYIRFEVLTAVFMKNSISWDKTPCMPLKVNRRFGGTCRIQLHDRRISQERHQGEAGSKQALRCVPPKRR
jgi:hypothetical protein